MYWDDVEAVAQARPQLHPHLNISSEEGTLTVSQVAEQSRFDLRDVDVYLCGPVPMLTAFESDLRRAGTPPTSIHFEEFSFR